MAFDPLNWAIGFTLTRTAGRLLRRAGAETLSGRLREAVLKWSQDLPEELSDLCPDAVVNRLFGADGERLGPKRLRLAKCFDDETVPEEGIWFEALCERWEEVRTEVGDDAQQFFRAQPAAVESHVRTLAKALHEECIKNEALFKVSVYRMLEDLSQGKEQPRPSLTHRARPADGLGVLHGVPQMPANFVSRSQHLEPLKAKLLGTGKAVAVTSAGTRKVGVQGMGGIGKTVLATAVVQEEEIRQAFPDGVFWLTFGQQPKLTARQVQLARWLGDEKAAFEDTQQGHARLEELLQGRTCLIVLDDIWSSQHVGPFDTACDASRLLITTRFENIVAAVGANEQQIDVLEDEQALVLLAKWVGTNVDLLPREARAVVKECGGLPLALAMIGAMIQRRPERWENALERLRNADLDRIRWEFPDYPYPDLLRAIEVSIDGLDEVKDWYLDFAVFPEDTPVPEAVLHTLWGAEGLDRDRAQDILDLLEDRSMLRRDNKGRISLHDLQFDYVRNRVGNRLAERHRKLLAAYRRCCSDGWHAGPDDGYFYQHLAWHLREAGKGEELTKLLFDYRWLRSKLNATDSNALMADYDLANDHSQARLVQSAIRLSSHRLADDPRHLPSQLCGRLLLEKGARIKGLLASLARDEESLWLRPISATLTPPGGPLLRILHGHGSVVTALAVMGDGRHTVSGSNDHTLKVWDLSSGKILQTLRGHEDGVTAVTVTGDGRFAVSGSHDCALKVWDLSSGQALQTLRAHESAVTAVGVTPDGRYAVAASEDKMLVVWDLAKGRLLHTLYGHYSRVSAVAVTGDGRYAVSGSDDKVLIVWDIASGEAVRLFRGHESKVTAVAVTRDGRRMVSGSKDGTLIVWGLTTGALLHTLDRHYSGVTAVAVGEDGRYAVSGSDDHMLRIWDLSSGSILRTLYAHRDSVTSVGMTRDGRYAVSASEDKTLKVWDLSSAKTIEALCAHEAVVTSVAVTGDGRYAVSASEDKTLKVWNPSSGKLRRTLRGHEGMVTAVAVVRNRRYAVSGSSDQTLRIWDLLLGKTLQMLYNHESGVIALAVTEDGHYAVSASEDEMLIVWDLLAGVSLHTLYAHHSGVTALAVTNDGRHAVCASDDMSLKVWDLSSGKLLRTLRGHENVVTSVAVTNDGAHAVSASDDKTLKVWDLSSGQLLRTLCGHEDAVTAVAVTEDGHYAVSGSSDQTLRVWDLASGNLLASFCGEDVILSCAIASDGSTVIAGEISGSVHLLRLEGAHAQAAYPDRKKAKAGPGRTPRKQHAHREARECKRNGEGAFDVFLSYNSGDRDAVVRLAELLKNRQVRVWVDVWELVPGRLWQDALEKIIMKAKTAAVLVGGKGAGPWQAPEMRGCLSQFVERGMPVIPVLLPGAAKKPRLPVFLSQFTWVDLREGLTDQGIQRLIWGIKGIPPAEA